MGYPMWLVPVQILLKLDQSVTSRNAKEITFQGMPAAAGAGTSGPAENSGLAALQSRLGWGECEEVEAADTSTWLS